MRAVGVIGAGQMGAGIAQVSAGAGYHVYLSDLDLAKAEEGSFTNYFSEPMVQLDPHKCIVMSGHYDNTVDKSWMCVGSPTATKNRMVNQLDTAVIADYFDIERMKKLFL